MEKYFTPSIEDIRVGYECESHETSFDRDRPGPEYNYDRWVPCRLSLDDVIYILSYQKNKLGGNGLRVPYLTQEQIESENWGYMGGHYIKNEWSLQVWNWRDSIWLYINELDVEENIIYWGECKDINTFRQIMKLLGI